MSDFSLTLVLQFKTSKIINDMAKVSIKSERITPFGEIFYVREQFIHNHVCSGKSIARWRSELQNYSASLLVADFRVLFIFSLF